MKSPLEDRNHLRICHIRAVEDRTTNLQPIHETFELGRLAETVISAGKLAPQIAVQGEPESIDLEGERSGKNTASVWVRHVMQMPDGALIDIRLMSLPWGGLDETINLLEDLHYETIDGEPCYYTAAFRQDTRIDRTKPFHQLVFFPGQENEPNWEQIQRLIYRFDSDAIEEHSSIIHPDELNRRPGQLAAVGRFGSVLWNLQDYVEVSLIISAAMTVAASSVAMSVRKEAHALLAATSGEADALREAIQQIDRLGIDLTFGAEAHATIGHLLPSLRVESFHEAIYRAADVRSQIDLASRMLERLSASASR